MQSGAYYRRVGAVMVHGASSGLSISVLPVCMEGSCSGRVAARRSPAARVAPPARSRVTTHEFQAQDITRPTIQQSAADRHLTIDCSGAEALPTSHIVGRGEPYPDSTHSHDLYMSATAPCPSYVGSLFGLNFGAMGWDRGNRTENSPCLRVSVNLVSSRDPRLVTQFFERSIS